MNSQIHMHTEKITQNTEALRCSVNAILDSETRGKLGQYMTPSATALFMASLFPESTLPELRLLDPGAGIGSLTSAFVTEVSKWKNLEFLEADSWEIDPTMQENLRQNMESIQKRVSSFSLSYNIHQEDFIESVSQKLDTEGGLWTEPIKKYTHCIMNPPYRKILASSPHRRWLRSAGIETGNLYTGFVALALMLMEEGGQLAAIIPRSFCNGPYYRPFRELLLKKSAIRHIHLFDSRNKAFKEDGVLQENIIILLERSGLQEEVTISTSSDNCYSDHESRILPFDQIISPEDKEIFIHIPLPAQKDQAPAFTYQRHPLESIELQVSTGPIVDFRLKEYLKSLPEEATVPLLYSCHFKAMRTTWPVEGKKPNAIMNNRKTWKGFFPKGFYVVVRRFSSKEEKRRIVASVVTPGSFADYEYLAFENHLNVFHQNKQGLDESLAWGLAAFLNTKTVDEEFRLFSGHTQVNATDLRSMRFPSSIVLKSLGEWAKNQAEYNDDSTEKKLREIERWQSTIKTAI